MVSCTLGANLESPDLLGVGDRNGTSNALRNFITGNAGSNLLSGGAGDNSLEGALVNDTLIDGGQCRDTILLDGGDDAGDIVRHAIDAASQLANLGGMSSAASSMVSTRSTSDLFDQFDIRSKDPITDGFFKIGMAGLNTNVLFDRDVPLAVLSNVTKVTVDDVLPISA